MSVEIRHCPHCQGPWNEVLSMDETLSAAGYVHIDSTHYCTNCRREWVHGEPQGDGPSRDYTCPVCREGELKPHKIDPRPDPPHADMKCPVCYYWTADVELVPLKNGEYTFAYEGIVGETNAQD